MCFAKNVIPVNNTNMIQTQCVLGLRKQASLIKPILRQRYDSYSTYQCLILFEFSFP